MGKSTISMAIFNSYVSLAEGMSRNPKKINNVVVRSYQNSGMCFFSNPKTQIIEWDPDLACSIWFWGSIYTQRNSFYGNLTNKKSECSCEN